MDRKKILVVMMGFVAAIILMMPSVGCADWSLRFGDNGWSADGFTHINFNKIEFVLPNVNNTGITFAGNSVTNFSSTGWSTAAGVTGATTSAVSTGPAATGTLYWTVNFAGTSIPAMVLDYWIYGTSATGTESVFGTRLFVNNGAITFSQGPTGWLPLGGTPASPYLVGQNAVPIPSAVLLFSTGLVGVAVLRKRVRQKNEAA